MIEQIYNFETETDFFIDIGNIDINVPLRSQGRRAEHTERYSIVSILKIFYELKYLTFPFKLIHRDKPDFVIENCFSKIGIEFTESVPEQLARAEYLLEIHFPNGILEPEFFGWNSPTRNNSEILKILKKSQKALYGDPSFGKSIENKWIYGISDCITFKTEKLNKRDFSKYDTNLLLIYDNQVKSTIDKKYISNKLRNFLSQYYLSSFKIKFDKIFIESGDYIYILDYKSESKINILLKNKG